MKQNEGSKKNEKLSFISKNMGFSVVVCKNNQ